ncbi:YkgJ family cysteine cluster protein [Billgrantia saliphila]|uniref:YkgJ family cysteine cluster protein n=1 Tax=Billgrantia saliphila TaxID=1848458 RepID=UPI000CE4B29A|nr:YkgJ family cysteine cluster protein [Halomonas saliphila]
MSVRGQRSNTNREVVRTECRPGCGACCIAPSISSPIPGMPQGKPAGVRCVQLDENHLCQLFGDPRRPAVCHRFDYDPELCGDDRDQALERIALLEHGTA